jgi:hypothetical protein
MHFFYNWNTDILRLLFVSKCGWVVLVRVPSAAAEDPKLAIKYLHCTNTKHPPHISVFFKHLQLVSLNTGGVCVTRSIQTENSMEYQTYHEPYTVLGSHSKTPSGVSEYIICGTIIRVVIIRIVAFTKTGNGLWLLTVLCWQSQFLDQIPCYHVQYGVLTFSY